MAASPETVAFARDLFSGLGEVTARPMFGGAGLYCEGAMFALVTSSDRIFLKADGVTAKAMQAEGAEPFTYEREGQTRTMGYWTLPDAAMDDPDEAMLWARRSLDLAHAAKKA